MGGKTGIEERPRRLSDPHIHRRRTNGDEPVGNGGKKEDLRVRRGGDGRKKREKRGQISIDRTFGSQPQRK
jgi:hypothetical protein